MVDCGARESACFRCARPDRERERDRARNALPRMPPLLHTVAAAAGIDWDLYREHSAGIHVISGWAMRALGLAERRNAAERGAPVGRHLRLEDLWSVTSLSGDLGREGTGVP